VAPFFASFSILFWSFFYGYLVGFSVLFSVSFSIIFRLLFGRFFDRFSYPFLAFFRWFSDRFCGPVTVRLLSGYCPVTVRLLSLYSPFVVLFELRAVYRILPLDDLLKFLFTLSEEAVGLSVPVGPSSRQLLPFALRV
jgi:hypothetical protein